MPKARSSKNGAKRGPAAGLSVSGRTPRNAKPGKKSAAASPPSSAKGLARHMRLSEQERIELALLKYKPFTEGKKKEHSNAWLAKDFSTRTGQHVAATTVGNAIRDAFQQGWVTVRPPDFFMPPYEVDKTDRKKLRDELARSVGLARLQLRTLHVVHNAGEVTSRTLHAQVGDCLAKHLRDHLKFRSGDIVAVGSGRGAHYFARALEHLPRIAPKSVSIVSLTGSVFVEARVAEDEDDGQASIDRELDADLLSTRLARYFRSVVHNYPMLCPIAFDSPAMRDRALRRSGLKHIHQKQAPDEFVHAFVGIGIFHRKHRLYDAVTAPTAEASAKNASNRPVRDPKEAERIVQPIATLLTELANKVDKIITTYPVYFPVADICNRLFVIPPPDELAWREEDGVVKPFYGAGRAQHTTKVSDADKKMILGPDAQATHASKRRDANVAELSITELVNRINDRMATITKSELRKLNVLLIAATWQKARGLIYVLRRFPDMIKTLVIDELCEREMLRILKQERGWIEAIAP